MDGQDAYLPFRKLDRLHQRAIKHELMGPSSLLWKVELITILMKLTLYLFCIHTVTERVEDYRWTLAILFTVFILTEELVWRFMTVPAVEKDLDGRSIQQFIDNRTAELAFTAPFRKLKRWQQKKMIHHLALTSAFIRRMNFIVAAVTFASYLLLLAWIMSSNGVPGLLGKTVVLLAAWFAISEALWYLVQRPMVERKLKVSP